MTNITLITGGKASEPAPTRQDYADATCTPKPGDEDACRDAFELRFQYLARQWAWFSTNTPQGCWGLRDNLQRLTEIVDQLDALSVPTLDPAA